MRNRTDPHHPSAPRAGNGCAFAGLACAAAIAFALAGCGSSGSRLQPPPTPENPQTPPPPVAAAPAQVLLEPPPKIEPPPTATKRALVLVTERVGQAETPRRDPESESILSEALLSVSAETGIEVVKKGTYDEILERDFESLVQRGFEENAQVFTNLLKAGVDYLAMGEIGASELSRDIGGGKTLSERFNVHAGVELVRTDNAQVLAAGNADAAEKAFRDAKTRALHEAAQKLAEVLRGQPKGSSYLPVTITVEGLSEFADADRICRKLREIPGVIWSRDLRFSASAAGTPGGVARYELAWTRSPEELRNQIGDLDAGVLLAITKIEGTRWNYRVIGKTIPPKAPPQPRPETPPPPKAETPPPPEEAKKAGG